MVGAEEVTVGDLQVGEGVVEAVWDGVVGVCKVAD